MRGVKHRRSDRAALPSKVVHMRTMSSPTAPWVKMRLRIIMLVIAVLVFAGDRVTKALVEERIPDHAVIPILPGCFNLTNTKNTGAAFGMFSESPAAWKTAVLVVVSVVLLVSVVGIVWRTGRLHWATSVGLACILGGALSNLYDRIRMGQVVDFLDFYLRTYHWATFNLADSSIVVGAGILVAQVIFSE
jgi:signal peptidase II